MSNLDRVQRACMLTLAFLALALSGCVAPPGAEPLAASGRVEAEALLASPDESLPRFVAASLHAVRFEQNVGQAHGDVRFLARLPGMTLFFTPMELVVSYIGARGLGVAELHPDVAAGLGGVVRLGFVGANPNAQVVGSEVLPGKSHYLTGPPEAWRSDVSQFGRITYLEVWPGVDMVFYANAEGALEQDFVVRAGADVAQVRMRVTGAGAALDGMGNLVLDAKQGPIVLRAPSAYQESGAQRVNVPAEFRVEGGEVGYWLGPHDASLGVVIDPVFDFSTFLGGTEEDTAYAIATDGGNNIYVTGITTSTDLDVSTGVYHGSTDLFVFKWNANNTQTQTFSTYLGGSSFDYPTDIAVNATQDVFITGTTWSGNLTIGNNATANRTNSDVFLASLTFTGAALNYVYIFGGGAIDAGQALALNADGTTYVSGYTWSTNFTDTIGLTFPYQTANAGGRDAFIAKVNAAGTGLDYRTYYGSAGNDTALALALDALGRPVIAGATRSTSLPMAATYHDNTFGGGFQDGFVAHFSADLGYLLNSTYWGGGRDDWVTGLAVRNDDVYVAGTTMSTNLTTVAPPGFAVHQVALCGYEDAFLARFNFTQSTPTLRLNASTYLGGDQPDFGRDLLVDASGNAYVIGNSWSQDVGDCGDKTEDAGRSSYGFITKLPGTAGTPKYTEEVVATKQQVAFGASFTNANELLVAGMTNSMDLPVANFSQGKYGQGIDAFVRRYPRATQTEARVEGENRLCPLEVVADARASRTEALAIPISIPSCSASWNLTVGAATTQLFIASGIAAHVNASITLCVNWTVTINTASYNATQCDPHIAAPGEVQWARLELKNAQGAGPSLSPGAYTLVATPSGNATRGLVDYFEAETAT